MGPEWRERESRLQGQSAGVNVGDNQVVADAALRRSRPTSGTNSNPPIVGNGPNEGKQAERR